MLHLNGQLLSRLGHTARPQRLSWHAMYGLLMASITVESPDVHKKNMTVDDRGRVYVGKELAGDNVTITVEVNNG